MKNANNKTALVTGASSGIGKATAKALAAAGYTVYAAARRIEMMEDLKPLGCIPVKMDITREDDVIAVVAQITRDHGGVDVLINNAGFAVQGSVEETTLEDARYQFDVNLFGLGHLTQLVLPYMRDKKAGKIVNVSSIAGKVYGPLSAWYIASKHALEGWSDCLRVELKSFSIDVIIVEPGTTGTELISIFVDPMVARSGHGPYAKLTNTLADWAMKQSKDPKAYSPPSVIAETIHTAITARRPKTRYAAGKLARPMIFMRQWLSDKMFDRMIMAFIR
jgi:NAD(P)-dependent dehydrogenase (short-subunit alcohol dehydrogenase family)